MPLLKLGQDLRDASFVNRGLALVRPETPYVSGWCEKAGSQLYVNRGIGTTGPQSASAPGGKLRCLNWSAGF